ncbi:hypothetical protein OIU84_018445, partial [Salix udensis]
MQILFFSTM